jgi:hypothetical protein
VRGKTVVLVDDALSEYLADDERDAADRGILEAERAPTP